MLSIDRALTDLGDPDPFVIVSAGRAVFRMEDLLQLVTVVGSHDTGEKEEHV
jgi:hypothetical protein